MVGPGDCYIFSSSSCFIDINQCFSAAFVSAVKSEECSLKGLT